MANTEIYNYTFNKEDPYTFLSKYRLVGIDKLSINTKLNILNLIKNEDLFHYIDIKSLLCELILTKSSVEEKSFITVDIEIMNGEVTLSVDNESIENYLMSENYVEVSKY